MSQHLSASQIAYLSTQHLGRLATVDAQGAPQNNPVGFAYNPATDTIDIGGANMARSRKFRNLATNEHVAFVVDDLPSVSPWRVRCVEIRGTAQALKHPGQSGSRFPGPIIRIHPEHVIAFGIDHPAP